MKIARGIALEDCRFVAKEPHRCEDEIVEVVGVAALQQLLIDRVDAMHELLEVAGWPKRLGANELALKSRDGVESHGRCQARIGNTGIAQRLLHQSSLVVRVI